MNYKSEYSNRITRLRNDFGAWMVFILLISSSSIIIFLNWLMSSCFINGFHWRIIHLETWQIHLSLLVLLLIIVNYPLIYLLVRIYGNKAME